MTVASECDLHQNRDTSILLENFDPNNTTITRSRKKKEMILLHSEILQTILSSNMSHYAMLYKYGSVIFRGVFAFILF